MFNVFFRGIQVGSSCPPVLQTDLWPLACFDCFYEFRGGRVVSCECYVLSGRGLYDGPTSVTECDQVQQ
jgi:hypothetical protein